MHQLVEHHSRKAARILDSTRELVLDHGAGKVTVTEIAQAAGVGKGTVYLYWPSKEDLIRGLFARDMLTGLTEIITHIEADPTAVLPSRLAPRLITTARGLPLARRVQRGDPDLMRLLSADPSDRALFERTKPSALCDAVMPVLHHHGLVRTDRPLPALAYTMHAILTGFATTMHEPETAPLKVPNPEALLSDTVAHLIDPPKPPTHRSITAAAEETLDVFRNHQAAFLTLITHSQTPTDQESTTHT